MLTSLRTRAEDVRALARAIALGSSAGLVIGAAYLLGSGGEPVPRPVPTVFGPLQAAAFPAGRLVGLQAPQTRTAASPAPLRVENAGAKPSPPLRDRFKMAAALHDIAQPFRLQQVADASSDLHCLTEAVYFEARGEAQAGQQAVAQVVLNRVRHPAFPKTICAVVHQHAGSGCQFSFACSRRQAAVNSVAWRRAETIAASEMHGAVMTAVGDATHFQGARASPFAGLLKVAQVGAHIFYRFGGHAGASAMFHQAPSSSATPPKVEVARLEAGPAPKSDQPDPEGVRVKATLYPVSALAPSSGRVELAAKPTPSAMADSKPALAMLAHAAAALSPAEPGDGREVKPALISVALAQP